MSDRLRDGEREQFTEALAEWGMSPERIADTLEDTAFSLGLVELKPETERSPPELAIVVDDRRDAELRDLFAWRESSTESDYWAGWDVRQPLALRVVLGSDEQALVRFGCTILKPSPLERRYLLSVNAETELLTLMQIAGSGIWLVAGSLIQREAARGGPQSAYDLRSRSLLVGRVTDPIPSLDEALAHVGSPRPADAQPPPPNRAQRRAAARGKGG
ncbi:MAG TPA: hypothetical protein VHW26_04405 [Solirubrobacteraceae bacterium]|jgi:hypothetical protein|nr:hypothetical protein [Solirubrobacteraceae bacterium]